MHLLRVIAFAITIALSRLVLPAASLEPLHAHCVIGPSDSEQSGAFSIRIFDGDDDCYGYNGRHCNSNFNHDPFTRLTGITRSDLARDGARLTATLAAEAGAFTCTGTVQEGVLHGDSLFIPDPAFVDRMEKMGFGGFTSEKLEAYAFLNVQSDWARSLQQAGVKGMSEDKLIALRVQKVDPEEVRQIRALGYQPSLDDLIQIRIFHITPDFIRKMQDRGFKDLTLAKLVQIKIFKLDE